MRRVDAVMSRHYRAVLAWLCRWTGRSNFWWARAALVVSLAANIASNNIGRDVPYRVIWGCIAVAWTVLFSRRIDRFERSVDRGRPHLDWFLSALRAVVPYFAVADAAVVVMNLWLAAAGQRSLSYVTYVAVDAWAGCAACYWASDLIPPTSTITARLRAWWANRPRIHLVPHLGGI